MVSRTRRGSPTRSLQPPGHSAGPEASFESTPRPVSAHPRPSTEDAPGEGTIEVTGFKSGAPRTGARGPVTVVGSPTRANHPIRDLNSLPLGAPSACLESVPLWSVAIYPLPNSSRSFTARSEGCDSLVAVTISGVRRPVLVDRTCLILRDVAALLPDRAYATRSSAEACARDVARKSYAP